MTLPNDPRLALYLDENMSERLIDALKSRGYDAISVNQMGTKGFVDAR